MPAQEESAIACFRLGANDAITRARDATRVSLSASSSSSRINLALALSFSIPSRLILSSLSSLYQEDGKANYRYCLHPYRP